MPAKVLLLGMDGAEPALVRQWAVEGELTRLGKLLQDCFHTPLETPKGFGDGVFWSTLFTGCNAGRHGHYFPWQFDRKTYGTWTFSFDDHYRRDPFWLYASMMGKRVGIVDIYSSPLTRGINGIQVMDWMIHDRTSDPRSWPEPIIDTLQEKYMEDPLNGNSEVTEPRTEEEWIVFHRGMIERIQAKTQSVSDLVRSNDWDLFAVGFCDAHDVGHQSWHWHDPQAVNHPASWREKYGDPVLQIYRELDRAVGAVIDAADADAIYVVVGLGMGQQTTCNPAFDQILGHLSGFTQDRRTLRGMRQVRPYFDVPHNMNSGALRFNVKGRESHGVIEPEDIDGLTDKLETELAQVTDAETGKPVVSEIVRNAKVYSGDYVHQLPDLMVVWQREFTVGQVHVPGLGVMDITPDAPVESRSGDHTPNAMLISNQRYQADTPKLSTESVAPTIARKLGINLPGVDGQAWVEIS